MNQEQFYNQEMLEAVLKGLGESICIIGKDLTIQWVNSEFEKHGGSLDQIKGKVCFATFYHRESECIECPTRKAFQTGEVIRAIQIGYDNRIYEVTASPIRNKNDEILYVVELTRDITEKRMLQEKLQASNENLAQRINELKGLYSLSTEAMKVTQEKRIYKELTRIAVEALPGKSILTIIAADSYSDQGFTIESYFSSMKRGNNSIIDKYSEILKSLDQYDDLSEDNLERIFSKINSNILKGTVHIPIEIQDKVEAIFSVFLFDGNSFNDDEKNFLHELSKQLYFVLQRRYLERQIVQSAKLAAAGELTATIAHEIRNPLYGIKSCLEILSSDYPAIDEELNNILNLSMEEVNRITGLLNQLLTFCKVAEEKMERVNINDLIKDILIISSNRFKNHSISVERFFDLIPEMEVSPNLIKQVFLNIINNAIDAMPKGGELKISTSLKKKHVLISFSDTGKGIAENRLDKIFQPFYTTKKEVHGVGLGLSVSYGIIKRHNGEIKVSSNVKNGTVFTIILPVKQDKSHE